MTHPLPKPWTVDDFLAWERRQPQRYEFVGGVIRMMVGGSNAHTIIKGNVFAALRARLQGGQCRALAEGAKVVTATATMYPDAIVVCGPIDLGEDQVRAPAVVVEVLSRSTEDHDRGAKWVAYRDLASFQHYLLIAQDERRVEVYSREAKRWSLQVVAPPDPLPLPAIAPS
jgi:Uma2 family endonuclease